MIDLRSDTVTIPTPDMRRAMAEAHVGDDVYGEDPTVNELQEYAAELLGKEAALFVPTGVMSNQIAIALHTRRGDEVITESEAHIFHYETAAPAMLSGVQLYCVPSSSGAPDIENLRMAIRPGDYYFPRTALICLENTHNRHGGSVLSLEYIRQVSDIARMNGIAYHCDGARLWNACAASGISAADYAANFDTISACLSKGLGAPAGSLLAGTKVHIETARKYRKIFGGGMRQTGILAAAGLHALKFHRDFLPYDHENARLFAYKLAEAGININPNSVQTNIVLFEVENTASLIAECRKRGVLISSGRPGVVRAVFHFQINRTDAIAAAGAAIDAMRQ